MIYHIASFFYSSWVFGTTIACQLPDLSIHLPHLDFVALEFSTPPTMQCYALQQEPGFLPRLPCPGDPAVLGFVWTRDDTGYVQATAEAPLTCTTPSDVCNPTKWPTSCQLYVLLLAELAS